LRAVEEMVRDAGYVYRTRQENSIAEEDVANMKIWEDVRKNPGKLVSAGELRALHKALGLTVPMLREIDDHDPRKYFERALDWPWYDALTGISRNRLNYYMACVRRGERLTEKPRIRIETIHGVKGAQADNVMLLTDMSSRTARGFDHNPDAEHRVFYVGITRTKQQLNIIMPQGTSSYPL